MFIDHNNPRRTVCERERERERGGGWRIAWIAEQRLVVFVCICVSCRDTNNQFRTSKIFESCGKCIKGWRICPPCFKWSYWDELCVIVLQNVLCCLTVCYVELPHGNMRCVFILWMIWHRVRFCRGVFSPAWLDLDRRCSSEMFWVFDWIVVNLWLLAILACVAV